MTRTRKKTAPLRTAAQFRALTSPVSVEIIQALRTGGPATVAQLGSLLGRQANSLHYHMRKLTRASFVRKVGTRPSGARTEAIYDMVADDFVGPSAPKDPAVRKLAGDAVNALLRLAGRNFAQVIQHPADLIEEGKYCNIHAARLKAWLTRRQLAEVNRHLDALREIFITTTQSQRGKLFELTLVFTPVRHEPGLRDRSRDRLPPAQPY